MLNDHDPFQTENEDDSGVVFRDVITLTLLGFVVITLLILPFLNPPAKTKEIDSPGNVIVEIVWPNELDTDVDLWVQAPGDTPVGYSNKGSQIFNLLRDDFGRSGDITNINHEISASRGVVPGEYTVNLHLYRNRGGKLPIPVQVLVRVKKDSAGSTKNIVARKVELIRVGQEITVFRFELDKDGNLVPGSVHNIFKPLRSGI